jgi:DNA-binding transcriptional ArsR family regulator
MRVTDPRALRALTHPLRLDLLELLAVIGPATAATCARHLKVSQASCSFHLRQLSKYGFVEQLSGKDRRERPWRLTSLEQSWSSVEGGVAGDELDRVFVEREADRIMRWAESKSGEPEDWRRASFLGGLTLPVDVEELNLIAEQLLEVLRPYTDRLAHPESWPDDARLVRIFLSATPTAGEGEEELNAELKNRHL